MQVSHFAKYEALVEEASRDPRLALRDCERRMKKSPQDPAVNLFKVHILVKLRNYEQAHSQCVELAKLPRVAEDGELISELLRLERRILQALARSGDTTLVKALETHKDCLPSSFGALVAYGFWEAAESAAIALQKLRPKDKQRQHVRFLMSELYARSCKASKPTVSNMRERLLKAMVKKAVDGSALSSTQDLRFFLQLHVEMQDWTAAVELLDNPKLGLFSPFGMADIEFIRVKLQGLAELKRWQDIHDFCVHIIKGGTDGEEPVAELRQWRFDALVWQHLTDALVELKNGDSDFDFEDFSAGLVPDVELDSSSSRVIWVARMRFAAGIESRTGKNNSNILAKVCCAYLEEHHARRYCYEDLQPYLKLSSGSQSAQILQHAQSLASRLKREDERWATAELNSLKLQFFMSLSKERPATRAAIIDYVVSVLRYIDTLKSMHIGDDSLLEQAFLLAVSGIETTMGLENNASERSMLLLQAIFLLETTLLDSNAPTSYRARLFLITFYRRMGCISLTMQQYQALRIREIQNDTISHLLYHRISLLHAFAAESVEQKRHKLDMPILNPTLGLQKVIDWYDVAADRTNRFVSGPVDEIRYDKVQEFLGLKERLQTSQWRQLATLERRRIARLTDRAYDETDQKIDFLSTVWGPNASDTREFSRGIAFREDGDSEWLPRDTADGSSALYYVAALTQLDATQSLLAVKDPVSEYKNSLVRLARVAETLKATKPLSFPVLEGEQVALAITQRLRPLVVAAVLGDKPEFAKGITIPSEKESEGLLAEAATFITSLQPHSPDQETKQWQLPDDITICTLVSQLECLKTLTKLADLLVTVSKQKAHILFKKVKADTLLQLKKDATTKGDVLQSAVQDWRRNIKTQWRTLLDPMARQHAQGAAQGEVTAEVVNLVGQERAMNTLAPVLRDSMIETLDGILKIRIG